jgi:pimeloyl-ACP methyl ester carboxylesterase
MKNKFVVVSAAPLAFSILILLLVLPSLLFTNSIVEATPSTTPSLSIVSTRGDFGLSSGDLLFRHSPTSYDPPISEVAPICTPDREIVIYVHGWNADEQDALDQFNIVQASLDSLGYRQPIIGFSWDSNTIFTGFNPFNWFDAFDWTDDWQTAKEIAQKNGLKLGKFILDLKRSCANADIHLVGHSLGASVILNALDRLHNDPRLNLWNANVRNYKVDSVHLLGAAVSPASISITNGFGFAIINEVDEFHNKYSIQDDTLETAYLSTERHRALGEEGARGWQSGLQDIYQEQEVSIELSRDGDGDGINEKDNFGDDHMGYAGVVNQNTGQVKSDGVMNLLVNEWR